MIDYNEHRSAQRIDARLLIDLQRRMIERHGEFEREMREITPRFPGWPDAPFMKERFVATIGGMDFYRGKPSSSHEWIIVQSDDGPDYITTDNPIRHIPGFFDPQNFYSFTDEETD